MSENSFVQAFPEGALMPALIINQETRTVSFKTLKRRLKHTKMFFFFRLNFICFVGYSVI